MSPSEQARAIADRIEERARADGYAREQHGGEGGAEVNPWAIARTVWPGCFEEPWQDEQCDRGWELPTVWVVRGSQFVRPVVQDLQPLVPGWDSWGRMIPRPGPVVPQVAVTPMTLRPDGRAAKEAVQG